jgi:hypothetical protein
MPIYPGVLQSFVASGGGGGLPDFSGLTFLYEVEGSAERTIRLPVQADWTDHGVKVARGASGAWDRFIDSIGQPTLAKRGDTYYIYYAGGSILDPATSSEPFRRKLGMATAADPTGTWTKHFANPILTFNPQPSHVNADEEGVYGAYAIVDEASLMHMLWMGMRASTSTDVQTEIYYSTSSDGFTWTNNTAGTAVKVMAYNAGWPGMVDNELTLMAFSKKANNEWWIYFAVEGAGGKWDFCKCVTSAPDTWLTANATAALPLSENPLDSGQPYLGGCILYRNNDVYDLVSGCLNTARTASKLFSRNIPSATPGSPATTGEVELYSWTTAATARARGTILLDRAANRWLMLQRYDGQVAHDQGISVLSAPINYETTSLIPSLPDLSGNANHAVQTTPASRPALLLNNFGTFDALDFSSDRMVCGSIPVALEQTYVVVAKADSVHLGSIMGVGAINNATAGSSLWTETTANAVQMIIGNGTTRAICGVGSAYSVGSIIRAIGRSNSTTVDCNVNGVNGTQVGHSLGSVGSGIIQLGAHSDGSNAFDGKIAFAARYNRRLTDGEVSTLMAYLQSRFPDAGAPATAVTLDAFTGAERTGDPWTGLSHLQGASASYALVLVLTESSVTAITSVTYGGVTMNAGPSASSSGSQNIRSYYLDATQLPAAGSKSVVVDPAGAIPGMLGVWTLIGANTGAPNRNNTASSAGATSLAPSLTGVGAGAIIISGSANNAAETPSLSGGTQRFADNESAAGQGYGVGDSFPAGSPAGTVTHTWSSATSQRRAALMLEILPG